MNSLWRMPPLWLILEFCLPAGELSFNAQRIFIIQVSRMFVRALTLSVMRFSFPAFSQGSSVVEQGTHKPLVGSSTLPPGSVYALGLHPSRIHRQTLHRISH